MLFNPQLVRQRIEKIEQTEIKRCYQLTYLACARIGEIISLKCPSDKTAHPTGANLSWHTETYTVNLQSKPEYESAFFTLLTQNRRAPQLEEILAIKEDAVIFTVTTEKRKGGWTREIALPLNPDIEPWSKQLLDYAEKQSGDLFPYYRQQLYPLAKKAFKGLTVEIKPYERAEKDGQGNYVFSVDGNGNRKLITHTVNAHIRTFSQHDLRKTRRTELENIYGFTPEERQRYGGWSRGIEERYNTAPSEWKKSFCKLLTKSYSSRKPT